MTEKIKKRKNLKKKSIKTKIFSSSALKMLHISTGINLKI
jgi:hypothetical protein